MATYNRININLIYRFPHFDLSTDTSNLVEGTERARKVAILDMLFVEENTGSSEDKDLNIIANRGLTIIWNYVHGVDSEESSRSRVSFNFIETFELSVVTPVVTKFSFMSSLNSFSIESFSVDILILLLCF